MPAWSSSSESQDLGSLQGGIEAGAVAGAATGAGTFTATAGASSFCSLSANAVIPNASPSPFSTVLGSEDGGETGAEMHLADPPRCVGVVSVGPRALNVRPPGEVGGESAIPEGADPEAALSMLGGEERSRSELEGME
jgi:hypothetical protein